MSTIRSGRDIFPIGGTIQTPEGHLRILSVRHRHDYVEYVTEPVVPRVLSFHRRPTVKERAKVLLDTVREALRRGL